jgi:hypothetical protein
MPQLFHGRQTRESAFFSEDKVYASLALPFSYSEFQGVYLWISHYSQNTVIITINSINQIIFVMETHSVFYEVGTKFVVFFLQCAQNKPCLSVCPSTCINLRTTGWFLVKFSMGIMPLEATLNSRALNLLQSIIQRWWLNKLVRGKHQILKKYTTLEC